jgi:hypothetical protein
VRLTPEERLQLEAAARQRGFRGLADFFRGAALTMAGAAPPSAPSSRAAAAQRRSRSPQPG